MALAYDDNKNLMPHVVQQLRMGLGFMPALWAGDGDCVLVDDVAFAVKQASRLKGKVADVLFLSPGELSGVPIDGVLPWGWDGHLCRRLVDGGLGRELLPSDGRLHAIRSLSSRRQTTAMLHYLRHDLKHITVGKSVYVSDIDEVVQVVHQWHNVVVKAPWSSSGRGLRYVSGDVLPPVKGWIGNVIARQGGVMIEPYYNKVCDFGMEFEAHADGHVTYQGLSLFVTRNGAYTGSLIASEADKRQMLSRYLPRHLLEETARRICSYLAPTLRDVYQGPFGVDMMVVAGNGGHGFMLHPCVEVNLRRTMGHVALSLYSHYPDTRQMLSIERGVNCRLQIKPLENYFVKVL